MKIWFLNWLISWACLVEGIIGILTLGLWSPRLALEASKVYCKERWKVNSKPRIR